MKSRKSRKTPTKKSQKLRLLLWTQRCCQIIPEIIKWTLIVYEPFGLIFKPLCYRYKDFSDLKNALFTRLVACQKFQTNPFISTQDFCQKLGWGDALLTERATANPFFSWAGNRSLWQTSMNRFFGEKQRVTTMKTKAQVCYYDNLQYLHLRSSARMWPL